MAPSSPPKSDPPPKVRDAKHLKQHQFKPGQSGNPAGFNDKALEKIAFTRAAREYTEEALDTLVWLMRQRRSLDIRLRATVEILNRSYGKPTEHLEVNDKKFVAYMPLPIEREAWLAAVQRRGNGHAPSHANGVTIEQSPSPSEPGNPSPSSKLNS